MRTNHISRHEKKKKKKNSLIFSRLFVEPVFSHHPFVGTIFTHPCHRPAVRRGAVRALPRAARVARDRRALLATAIALNATGVVVVVGVTARA
jgi:hypothetical protein